MIDLLFLGPSVGVVATGRDREQPILVGVENASTELCRRLVPMTMALRMKDETMIARCALVEKWLLKKIEVDRYKLVFSCTVS